MTIAATDTVSTLGAISSLLGAATVLYVAIDNRRNANRANREAEHAETQRKRAEKKVDAVARTTAATAVNVANVGGKVDANTALTEAVHTEVKSINGSTPTELLEATEGRRIEADIEPDDRTHAEQAYVDRLPDKEPPAR